MASNTNIQVSSLDFGNIKQNFINYLQGQTTFKDYNFTGSAMSTLLDVLAYNTQYNAFYLNMVANEMFLDSALQRSSVVSHAKLMNYVPQSAIGASAQINLTFNNVTTTTITLPQYSNFMSEAINGVNYNYVTTTSVTVPVINNTATFSGITLKQGVLRNYNFTVNSSSNPNYIFEIPDANVDTNTLQVTVQQNSSNSAYQVYNSTTDYLSLGSTDLVYFLQEAINGNYQIYFGDGILGAKLSDGNIVNISYLSTSGSAGGLANNFVLMDQIGTLGSYKSTTVTPYQKASQGKDKESIDSIKFQAPKAFSAQGRAVNKNDYITLLQQNNLGISFDAVSVWGGEENVPPVYGQVFVSLKPKGSYNLTTSQKQSLIQNVLKPVSVLTVEPVIVDPDYTYIQVNADVIYDPRKTSLTVNDMQNGIQNSIYNYSSKYLNTFNSTFSSYDLLTAINSFDPSITSSDFNINVQKKINPTLGKSTTYNLYFNGPLQRGVFSSTLVTTPDVTVVNPTDITSTISGVYFEEVPTSTFGVDSISIINQGYNYTSTPTVTITGDGTGATAVATIVNNKLYSVTTTNAGTGYTNAIATVTPAVGDTTGQAAALVVNLQGRYGTIRSYYNDVVNGKVIVSSNAGTIDYTDGIVTLTNFNPYSINNIFGQLTISVKPLTNIVSSTLNRLITIDPYDSSAVNVNVTTKKN
jgi:hypothetical protein